MKLPQLIIGIILFCFATCYAQEVNIKSETKKKNLLIILDAFKKQHQLHFSFDVNAIQDLTIELGQKVISIEYLSKILQQQTPYILEKISDTDYILIKNTKVINICGIVIDATSKFELAQASINTKTTIIDITDNHGFFELQLHPWDSVAISFLGYRTEKIKAADFSETNCDTIPLFSKIQDLSQVVIKEYLTKGIQKNQDGSVNISTKELRILPGLAEPDVLQSLQLLPGVNSPTEDPAGLYIRGGTPSQNLVIWDGIKMYHTGHFFNQISTFNPFIVKNVTTYRGGTSVQYGDRIAGVVVIESDDDLTEKVQGGGGFNLTHADAFAKIPISKKLGVLVAGRRSTTDLYQNITFSNLVRKVFQSTRADFPDRSSNSFFEEVSREDDFYFSDVNLKLIWKPNDRNTIKTSAILAENRLNNKQTIIGQTFEGSIDIKDILKLGNTGFSLYWKKKYTSGIHQVISFYSSSYKQQYDLLIDRINSNSGIKTINNIKDIGGEYTLNIPMTSSGRVRIGYQFAYNASNYRTMLTDIDGIIGELTNLYVNNGTNHTLYSEYIYNTPKTHINIGFRSYLLSNTNQAFTEPRIFSSIELWKNFRLTTSAEIKNQQLNNYAIFNDINSDIPSLSVSNNVWFISNNDPSLDSPILPIIKSKQFTIGGLYTYRGWNFDIEGYYKEITDIPSMNDVVLTIASNTRRRLNFGKENRMGIDFLIKKRIRDYRFWIGYSLSKSLFSFPTIQKNSFAGNFDQRHVFNISQTLKVNKFEFAIGWNYASGRPFTKIFRNSGNLNNNLGVTIDPNGINSSNYKDYHRLDASTTYRFSFGAAKRWKGMIGISVRNIYNRNNKIDQAYVGLQDENQRFFINSVDKESLQLTPDMVFRLQF